MNSMMDVFTQTSGVQPFCSDDKTSQMMMMLSPGDIYYKKCIVQSVFCLFLSMSMPVALTNVLSSSLVNRTWLCIHSV